MIIVINEWIRLRTVPATPATDPTTQGNANATENNMQAQQEQQHQRRQVPLHIQLQEQAALVAPKLICVASPSRSTTTPSRPRTPRRSSAQHGSMPFQLRLQSPTAQPERRPSLKSPPRNAQCHTPAIDQNLSLATA